MSKSCKKCGTALDGNPKFCPVCGHMFSLESDNPSNTVNNISKAEYFEKYASAGVEKRKKTLKIFSIGITVFQFFGVVLFAIISISSFFQAVQAAQAYGMNVNMSNSGRGILGIILMIVFRIVLAIGSFLLLRLGVKRRSFLLPVIALFLGFACFHVILFLILDLIAYIILIILISKDNKEYASFLKS